MEAENQNHAHILLIDDDENFGFITSNLIELDGHRTALGACKEEAVNYLSRHPDVDILLLDIDLGEGPSGLETLPELLSSFPHLQVIMLTSQNDIKTAVEAMKKGAFDYLTKPFKQEELARLIPQALERKKLSQLNQLYLEMIVHDLKNPLQNISMGLDVIDDKVFEEDAIKSKGMNLAKFGVWQIQSMIMNILNISCFEKTSLDLQLSFFKLLPCIREELAFLVSRIQFTNRNFQIITSLDENFEINSEKGLFLQILGNLLANALRFTPAKGVISMEILPGNDSIMEFRLKNSGSFIEEEYREKIFNKFFKSQYKQGQNFGLGLTFSRLAARLLGGDLFVESQKDPELTTFVLRIKNQM
ncbi:MAG: response regulator [Spirochaetales bacterium]|nr:response regulator [Spirochaetales bacterium]